MTDVVEIARSRRSRLAAEIAKLDDFIHMAEILVKYGDGSECGTRGRADDAGPIAPLFNLGAESENGGGAGAAPAGSDVPMPAAGPESAGDAPASPEAHMATPADAAATADDEAEASGADPDHFQFGAQVRGDEEELVLTNDLSADGAAVDASIGQKIRQRRWMMGMTKKQLAERLGIELDEFQKYERGESHIGTGRLWHLATALEVPVSYFFEKAEDRSAETRDSRPDRSVDRDAALPAGEVALAKSA